MHFSVRLPDRLPCYALRRAGVDAAAYFDHWLDRVQRNAPHWYDPVKRNTPVTFEVTSFYCLREKPVEVRIASRHDVYGVHLSIEVEDEEIGRKIQNALARYSVENSGSALDEREHKLL